MADSPSDTCKWVSEESEHALCELLLTVAGRDTNRLPSARRHVAALAAAIPFMTECQEEVARQRICHLETKWGPTLRGYEETVGFTTIIPELWVAKWLAMRRNSNPLLEVLHRAACAVWSGSESLLDVQEYAYAETRGRTLLPTTYDTFKEWMIQLRIAGFRHGGSFLPGSLCHWWVDQMAPTKSPDSTYSHCLAMLSSLRAHRANTRP